MTETRKQVKLRRLNVLLWNAIDDTTAYQLFPRLIGHIRRSRQWKIVYKQTLTRDFDQHVQWKNIDGIIASLNVREVAGAMLEKKKPLINVADDLQGMGIPGVHVDNDAVGRMAAKHLMECGVKHFACVGVKNRVHACRRWNGFNDELKSNGFQPACYFDMNYDPLGNIVPDTKNFAGWPLERWIITLQMPVGIFCINDHMGHVVTDACQICRIAVPHDAMILGVNNNEPLCNAAFPSLSSIEQPMDAIAERAVDMLDQAMKKHSMKDLRSVWLPPLRVAVRRSTDLSSAGDDYVQRALEYIQRNAHAPVAVDDVLRQAPVCRSLLERKFRENLGSTILSEIHRARIQHVKQLLLETDLTLDEIAYQCRFSSPSRLTKVFKRTAGCLPSEFRRKA